MKKVQQTLHLSRRRLKLHGKSFLSLNPQQ